MYVEARNIGNKAYISSANVIDRPIRHRRCSSPGSGRAVYAGVKARW